jgi:hypothetical protein
MIYFDLLFIRLSQPHDLGIVFNILTQVDLTYFYVIFLIKIFNNFIVQYCAKMVDWKLSFKIYFDLLSIRLYESYDQSYRFEKKLKFYIFFYFVSN